MWVAPSSQAHAGAMQSELAMHASRRAGHSSHQGTFLPLLPTVATDTISPPCPPLPTWKCLVLPGVGATAVFLEPNSALMVEDLPTLG